MAYSSIRFRRWTHGEKGVNAYAKMGSGPRSFSYCTEVRKAHGRLSQHKAVIFRDETGSLFFVGPRESSARG